jgi:hypothetical protein
VDRFEERSRTGEVLNHVKGDGEVVALLRDRRLFQGQLPTEGQSLVLMNFRAGVYPVDLPSAVRDEGDGRVERRATSNFEDATIDSRFRGNELAEDDLMVGKK